MYEEMFMVGRVLEEFSYCNQRVWWYSFVFTRVYISDRRDTLTLLSASRVT